MKALKKGNLDKLEAMLNALSMQKRKEGEKAEFPNIQEWCEENLWIKPKAGGLVRFKARPEQVKFFDYCQKCLEQGKPIRLIILKSRQLGISTAVEAFFFWVVEHYSNIVALVLANKRDSSRNIFTMMKRFYYNLPPNRQKPLEGGKPFKDQLEYSKPHSSMVVVQTAGGEEVGRSWTVNFVHASELAFYSDPDSSLTALNQAVPKPSETPFTAYIIESTANGNNVFRKYWDLAAREDSDWQRMFFSWIDDPECVIPLGEGEVLKLEKEEEEILNQYNWSLPQMKWYRKVRNDQCGGSYGKAAQEYPWIPSVAFSSSGSAAFNLTVIDRLEAKAEHMPPVFRGDIQLLSSTLASPELIEGRGPHSNLSIWDHPDASYEYVLGVDVSEGIGQDYSEIVVLQKDPVKVVAHYRTNTVKPQDIAVKAWLLGAYYHYGLLGVERNSIGQVVLGVLEHGHGDRQKYAQLTRYPKLYYETRIDTKNPSETERLGIITSGKSKDRMRVLLGELINDDDIEIYSLPLLNQLKGYTWNPESHKFDQQIRDDVSELYNDDGIMALAIANMMRLHIFGHRFLPKANRSGW